METKTVRLYSLDYSNARTYLMAALFIAGNMALPAILLKSVLLAAAAGWAAHRFNRISLPILLAVVLFYQVAGTLGEWAMVGSFFQAVQDFRIGLPGMAMQVVGGYALIKYSASL